MKVFYTTILLFSLSFSSFGQDHEYNLSHSGNELFIKGGLGTSWIILPKVFLIDETNTQNVWQILPATNNFTAYVGFQPVFPIGKNWAFAPELDINYLAGQVRVDKFESSESAQRLQSYWRLEVPISFAMFSRDNFWVSFGPVVYFTIADNKGFDETVYELVTNPDIVVDSDNSVGARFRLAFYIPIVKDRGYIDIKFDSDLGQHFTYENNVYDAKFSMQSVTVGFGYNVLKKK